MLQTTVCVVLSDPVLSFPGKGSCAVSKVCNFQFIISSLYSSYCSLQTVVCRLQTSQKIATIFFFYFCFKDLQSIGPLGRCFLLVNLSVCVSVCPSVCFFTLRYRLNVFLSPLPKVGCPICLEIRNPWGKINEKKWSKI